MSKITFRADDELITRLEAFDASKSEVMREALREYLDRHAGDSFEPTEPTAQSDSLDDLVTDRVDDLVETRVDELLSDRLGAFTPAQPQDVNVNVSLAGDFTDDADADSVAVNDESDASHESPADVSHEADTSKTSVDDSENMPVNERKTCGQCGENVGENHVYCPNCGEKSSHRVFCECGDELRSDWAFCPGCGRRTPAADVLDQA